MKEIYRRCQRKGFAPKHVAEVGVYLPETSNVVDYALLGVRTTLVEAHPDYVTKVETFFRDYPNVKLHPVAVADEPGQLRLVTRGASTFAEHIKASPSVVNDRYTLSDADTITVPCVRFDSVDDGTIDLLSIDIEGSEWFVIKHMVSLPAVVSVETHGKAYTNPYLAQIEGWMQGAGYRVWYRDNSDTVYVRGGTIALTAADRSRLRASTLRLGLRKRTSEVKRWLRS